MISVQLFRFDLRFELYHSAFTLCLQDRYKTELERINAIPTFWKKIEDLEMQFTAVLPEPLKPNRLDTTYYKGFQNRIERWIWIFKNSKDPRVTEFLKGCSQVMQEDELKSLCSCIASLYTVVYRMISMFPTVYLYLMIISSMLWKSWVFCPADTRK